MELAHRLPPSGRPHRVALVISAALVLATAIAVPTADVRAASAGQRVTGDRIAVGLDHACAITPDGGVECWGDNTNGELGDPSAGQQSTVPVAVVLPPGWRAEAVAVGEHHSCALLTDGEVACWGEDLSGQLGAGTGVQGPAPVLVDLPSGQKATALDTGPVGTCAVLDTGSVTCWGFQTNGELGQPADATSYHSPQPVMMPNGEAVTDLSLSLSHACAVLDTGTITCWGDNTWGQFGNGTTSPSAVTGSASTPILLHGGAPAIEVSAGWGFTCAVSAGGQANCWGINVYGRLGDETTLNRATPAPLVPAPSARVVEISAGHMHACARLDTGAVMCWGYNDDGQLGDGTTTQRLSPVAVGLDGGDRATALAVGEFTNCVTLADSTVTCWGRNGRGQVGDGTTTAALTPVGPRRFASGTRIAAVSTSASHTCILDTAGQVWCVGANLNGQVGRGTFSIRELEPGEPVQLPGGMVATAVSAGYSHTCALLVDGRVSCWGSNVQGQLGIGIGAADNLAVPSAPISLQGSGRARAIASGGRHTCALLTDGNVTCWGANEYGQLGDGGRTDQFATHDVVALPGGVGAVALTAGLEHTCVVQGNGAMACWGRNQYGQLGDTTQVDSDRPVAVAVAPGTRAISLDAGRFHTCALLPSGDVTCWGDNYWGQLGNGQNDTFQSTVAGTISLPGGHPTQAVGLAVGDAHSCALLDDGRAACWGYNGLGSLGDGTQTNSSTPVRVTAHPSGSAFRQLSSGFAHTCALLDTGQPTCWGDNWNGQLGTRDRTSSFTPVDMDLTPSPSGLVGTPGDASVTLAWQDPVSPYQPRTWTIEGSVDGSIWWPATVAATSPVGTTVTGLTNGVAYHFRVTTASSLAAATGSAETAAAVTPLAAAVPPAVVAPPPPPSPPPAPAEGGAVIETIGGSDLAELAAAVSRSRFGAGSAPLVHLADATRWADAVAAGAAAVRAGGPLLSVASDALPASTATEIERLGAREVVIVGGPDAISAELEAAIEAIDGPGGITVTRVHGTDRYATAAAVSRATNTAGTATVYLVSGTSPVDGLAAARFGRPVLLTGRDALPQVTATELLRLRPSEVVVVGGTSSVADTVLEQIRDLDVGAVTRLAGADRFATAALVAGAHRTSVATAVLVDGHGWAAPAAVTLLGDPHATLLFGRASCMPTPTATALQALAPTRVIVVGDTAPPGRRC